MIMCDIYLQRPVLLQSGPPTVGDRCVLQSLAFSDYVCD